MEKRELETSSLEERIAALRRQKGLSQEKVAEHLGVSRQAVAKWESGQSRPSTDNLIWLAEFFQVSVEELLGYKEPEEGAQELGVLPSGERDERKPRQRSDEERSAQELEQRFDGEGSVRESERQSGREGSVRESLKSRAPWLFLGISFFCIAVYLLVGLQKGSLQVGVLIGLFILAVPCQLFLHICFSPAVRSNSFSGLAGFDNRIAYNMEEVKRMIVQIDLHTGMLTTVYIFLITVTSLAGGGKDWLFGMLILFYAADFTGVILFHNYKWIDRLYRDEADQKRARRGMPFTILYILLLFGGTVALCVCFAVRGLENNTIPALKVTLFLLLGIGAGTVGYAMESRRLRKWDPAAGEYQRGKGSFFFLGLGVVLFAAMFFV